RSLPTDSVISPRRLSRSPERSRASRPLFRAASGRIPGAGRKMQNEIIINAERGETRVALLENGQFAELHIERERDRSVVGNVVKGRVSRVLPGMQAAFVD